MLPTPDVDRLLTDPQILGTRPRTGAPGRSASTRRPPLTASRPTSRSPSTSRPPSPPASSSHCCPTGLPAESPLLGSRCIKVDWRSSLPSPDRFPHIPQIAQLTQVPHPGHGSLAP